MIMMMVVVVVVVMVIMMIMMIMMMIMMIMLIMMMIMMVVVVMMMMVMRMMHMIMCWVDNDGDDYGDSQGGIITPGDPFFHEAPQPTCLRQGTSEAAPRTPASTCSWWPRRSLLYPPWWVAWCPSPSFPPFPVVSPASRGFLLRSSTCSSSKHYPPGQNRTGSFLGTKTIFKRVFYKFDRAAFLHGGLNRSLTLPLPRVINLKFPLQLHQKYHITQYEEHDFS